VAVAPMAKARLRWLVTEFRAVPGLDHELLRTQVYLSEITRPSCSGSFRCHA
jgi:hypothetical protein